MKNVKELRTKWLHVRITEEEYKQLNKEFSGTVERKISSYIRKMVLGKPMIKGVRDLSQEKLIQEFSGLLKDLNGVANNFNQAVHKMHTLGTHQELIRWII